MKQRVEIRPHFELQVALPKAEVCVLLRRAFSSTHVGFRGALQGDHAQLSLAPAQQRLWSPWLTFEVSEVGETTLLHGRFSSNPGFFTAYVAAVAVTTLSTLGFGFFALAQTIAGDPPTAVWGAGVGVFVFAPLSIVPFVGQRLAAGQTLSLGNFVSGIFEGVIVDSDTGKDGSSQEQADANGTSEYG